MSIRAHRQYRMVSAMGVTDGGGPNTMSGFFVVIGADIDTALKIAKNCPFLDIGSTLEVADMMGML